ncbi:MAG TPA: hypothetical protein VNO33_10345 [Kofleriaceae bacterium]|nr:hypothetical protein [Kofleriaceae bacterium]
MNSAVRVLVRAASLIALAVTGWASNVRWGTSTAVRNGPPAQWERFVVGAAMLSALVAFTVWLGTRAGAGPSRLWLRAAACLFALGVAAIAFTLRQRALDLKLPDMVAGPGWMWLATGAGLSIATAVGSFAVRETASQRSRARRRAASQRGR